MLTHLEEHPARKEAASTWCRTAIATSSQDHHFNPTHHAVGLVTHGSRPPKICKCSGQLGERGVLGQLPGVKSDMEGLGAVVGEQGKIAAFQFALDILHKRRREHVR